MLPNKGRGREFEMVTGGVCVCGGGVHQVVRLQGLRGETAQERDESKRAHLHSRPPRLGSDCVKVGHVFIAFDCVLSEPDGLGFRRGLLG